MTAHASYQYDSRFTLNEEKLRKMNDILLRRGHNVDENCKPTYKIRRSDFLIYETQNIEDILREENSQWQKIEKIIINMVSGDALSLNLVFDKNIKLDIEGDDRDTVFLIYSDLKQYIQNDVISKKTFFQRLFSLSSLTFLVLIITLVGFAAFFIMTEYRSNQRNIAYVEYGKQYDQWATARDKQENETKQRINEAARRALESKEISTKLDFLIERYISHPSSLEVPRPELPDLTDDEYFFEKPFFLVVLPVGSLLVVGVIMLVSDRLYGKNLFLIGKEVEKNARREAVKDKIVWGIIIAFIVGILSSLAVLLMFPTS